MKPGIDPKVDYVFKRLFGTESQKDVLTALLNAVIGSPLGEEVENLILHNPFSEKDVEEEKEVELDIVVYDRKKRLFGVEMQQKAPKIYPERILYYWSCLYSGQLTSGEGYTKLHSATSISFIDSKRFLGERYHRRFSTSDPEDGLVLTEQMAIHTIELPKFNLSEKELTTPLAVWSYFLRKGESLDTDSLPKALDIPLIRKCMEVLKAMSLDTRQRAIIEACLRVMRDRATEMEEAYQEGELIGHVQFSQELLGLPISPREELKALAPDALAALAERIKQQVKSKP